MKALLKILGISIVGLSIASCSTSYHTHIHEDGAYYTPSAEKVTVVEKRTDVPDNNQNYSSEYSSAGSNDESTVYVDEEGNEYYTDSDYYSDDYYDFSYTSRIRRFNSDTYHGSYYSDYYVNNYYYTGNPYSYGTSIYVTNSYYTPGYYSYYDWNWYYRPYWRYSWYYSPSYYYGYSWYNPYYYSWGYPYYGGGYFNGYRHGYYNGYWDGYYDGLYNSYGYAGYYDSYNDANSDRYYGPRNGGGSSNGITSSDRRSERTYGGTTDNGEKQVKGDQGFRKVGETNQISGSVSDINNRKIDKSKSNNVLSKGENSTREIDKSSLASDKTINITDNKESKNSVDKAEGLGSREINTTPTTGVRDRKVVTREYTKPRNYYESTKTYTDIKRSKGNSSSGRISKPESSSRSSYNRSNTERKSEGTNTYQRPATPKQRSYNQGKSTNRSYSPGNSSGNSRSYTPNRSSGNSRSYTPSRSSSRSYSPSRSSGSSRSYSPSRSSGSSRSYSPSRSSSRSSGSSSSRSSSPRRR